MTCIRESAALAGSSVMLLLLVLVLAVKGTQADWECLNHMGGQGFKSIKGTSLFSFDMHVEVDKRHY